MFVSASTPWHLLTDTLVISNRVITQETTGAWESTSSLTSDTFQAAVQPISASDNLQYGRDEQVRLVRVFTAPADALGTSYTFQAGATATINGTAGYRLVEGDTDLVAAGVLRRSVWEYPA